MDIFVIQEQLDTYYENNQLEIAYDFLLQQVQIAIENNRNDVILFLLNELIGYYRATAQFEEGEMMVEKILVMLNIMGILDTVDAATSFLNIATFYRAEGKFQESLLYYQKTKHLYQQSLEPLDERYCGFYNNMSLLYQELGDYHKALELESKALDIVLQLPNMQSEQAITYTNLSHIYLSLGKLKEAKENIYKAIELFDSQDSHYFSAISSLAHISYLEKEFLQAIEYYDQALKGIESVFGHNKDYDICLQNKKKVYQDMHQVKGLELCKQYYLTYGKDMIEKEFSKYKPYIAVGLCGFGSDCLGYDDDVSHDHDFGPGFCIWLPDDIYQEVGQDMQKAYDELPDEFMGYKRIISAHGQGRVGVFSINQFFYQFVKDGPHCLEDWLLLDENALLCCVNGEVFEDYLGEVTKIREQLSYFPEDIRIKKIAKSIAKMAQSGQYNYARCLKRHDLVSASLALHEFIDETLSVMYLLNKKYKPYYKWSYYGLKDCLILQDIKPLLKELVEPSELKEIVIEKICQKVITELKRQQLTDHDDDFLENHTQNVMSHIKDRTIREKHVMEG